jgi:hypothetical protein
VRGRGTRGGGRARSQGRSGGGVVVERLQQRERGLPIAVQVLDRVVPEQVPAQPATLLRDEPLVVPGAVADAGTAAVLVGVVKP